MYKTEYGFQGVDGIMADFGINSFKDFVNEDEIRIYFTVENFNKMFGESPSQEDLNEIASEFIDAWDE